MKQILLVFLGGGLGSSLRFLIGKWLNHTSGFPFGTFLVNVLGSFLIGVMMGFALKNIAFSHNTVLLFTVGFCGGFTTFSSFAYENHMFLKSGDFQLFLLYTFGSLILGLLAVWAGLWFGKIL